MCIISGQTRLNHATFTVLLDFIGLMLKMLGGDAIGYQYAALAEASHSLPQTVGCSETELPVLF